MEVKNGKLCLPTTYQSLLAIRKKSTKTINIAKPIRSDFTTRAIKENQFQTKMEGQQADANETSSDQQFVDKNVTEKIAYSDYQTMFDNFQNSKFDLMMEKISKQRERLTEQTPVKTLSINNLLKNIGIQSRDNIEQFVREFQQPFGRRNIDKLDSMLAFNKFFVILNRQKRFKIYDNCVLLKVEAGEEIYKEGDVQDYMYVVIKGCIRQQQKKNTSFQQKIKVNFVSHGEGCNFGDAQLVGNKDQKAKRHHSVTAAQQSYLLKIQNNFYRQLIIHSAQDDFQRKISSLLSTSIFSQTSKIFVTPLLSTLQKKILNLGEVLVRQGQPVTKLYFIGEGNVKLIYIDRSKRNIKHLNIEEKPKNFYVRGKTADKADRAKKNYSIHSTFYYPKEDVQTIKQFNYGKKKIIGDQLEYNEQIVFDELRTGDFLGGKSFLTPDQRMKRELKSQYFDSGLESKLSVVGSSTLSTIYSLEEKKFFSLSDSLQKMIIDGILKSKYFDERDIETKLQGHREWKKYSQNLVAKVIAEKKSRHNSFRV